MTPFVSLQAFLRLFVFALLLLLVVPAAGSAQAVSPAVVDLNVSTTPMDRAASGLAAGATALSRATAMALQSALRDRARPSGAVAIASRLAKLVFLDVPVIHFAAGVNHEFGHLAWARQEGYALQFRLRGGPWSSNAFDLRAEHDAPIGLPTYGGGFDAASLLQRRTWDRIGQENRSGVADAIFLIDGAVGRFYYIQDALSRVTGRIHEDLAYETGDPTRFVYQFVAGRDGYVTRNSVLTAARSTRARAWLNFADYGLWSQAWTLLRYIGRGDEATPVRWLRVKGIGVMPFSHYHLSPAGPQTEVGTRYRVGSMAGDVSVRWTDAVAGSRLLGTSIAWSKAGTAVSPRLRVDLWRGVTRKPGARVEAGFTATRWPSPRAGLQLAIGAKSEGYVLGLPQKATVYGQTGLRVRF